MTAQEFSDQFDVLYNNITSNQAPGLDEYEKSVFLTKAQDEILKSYFNPRLNKSAEGFDGNEKRQIDFSMVMKTTKYTGGDLTDNRILDNKDNTKRITIASDIMMFINEFADVIRGAKRVRLIVVPLGYQELNRLSSKPYKRPTHYQAWRVIDNANSINQVELIIGANDELSAYTIRYIKRPYPIILEDLGTNVSINGETLPYGSNAHRDTIRYEKTYTLSLEGTELGVFKNNLTGKDVKDYDIDMFSSVKSAVQNQDFGLYDALNSHYTIIHSNSNSDQACELDPILHEEILQRAVELAKAAWQGGLDSQIALGVNSETNMGYASSGQQQRQ